MQDLVYFDEVSIGNVLNQVSFRSKIEVVWDSRGKTERDAQLLEFAVD